jgi:hypothetical protein
VYSLTPMEGCWSKQARHLPPRPREGKILWMRDEAQFSVIYCKMTETVMKADCYKQVRLGMWQMLTFRKLARWPQGLAWELRPRARLSCLMRPCSSVSTVRHWTPTKNESTCTRVGAAPRIERRASIPGRMSRTLYGSLWFVNSGRRRASPKGPLP